MPDFDVAPVLDAPAVATAPWTDPAHGQTPSRLNSADVLPRYWRVELGATIELQAVVAGVAAPDDASLGGRLINWAWVEGPHDGLHSPPPLTSPVGGKSSRAQIDTTGADLGHYVVQAWREDGGAVLVPFEVETSAP